MDVTLVAACGREGRGGSPTAVVARRGARFGDAPLRHLPAAAGTSHAVLLHVENEGDGRTTPAAATLRFFTAEGELPSCGHGTVAALAVLAAARPDVAGRDIELRTRAGTFTGRVTAGNDHVEAAFDPGPVTLRHPSADERESVTAALGVDPAGVPPGAQVASVGRARLLLPVATRAALAALRPDLDALRAACLRLGLLGVYVHTPPDAQGRLAARMFAPAIGVPEDIANANSTACLAAHLARGGILRIAVDMGDTLGTPATVTATADLRAAATGPDPAAPRVRVGGTARITGTLTFP